MTMTEPVQFRLATLADRDALLALVTSAYRGESSRAGWTTEADLLDGARIAPEVLEHDLIRERSVVVIALREELPEPIACAHICEDVGAGYFGMFAVAPSLQGAGIGDAVLRKCERIVRDDWRLRAMRMAVIDLRVELVAWYLRRGYRRTGVCRPFPYGDTRFGVPKREDLRFEMLEKTL